MDNSTPDIIAERLVRYLDGEGDSAERKDVESLLDTNPALQSAYESLLHSREAIKYYGLHQQVAAIRSSMKTGEQAPIRKMSPGRRIFRYSIAVAASLVLLIGGYWTYHFYTLSANKVVAAHYRTYELPVSREGNGTVTATEKLYQEKKYRELVSQAATGDSLNAENHFLAGMSWLELKNTDKAIDQFKKALMANQSSGRTQMNDEAEFYLALAYISNHDYDLALPLLRKIREDAAHTYHREVTNRMIRQVRLLKWR